MSASASQAASETGARASDGADPREQDGSLPVLAGEARVVRAPAARELLPGRHAGAIGAVQAAAVAAGGFVAGAAAVGLVTRRRHRSSAPRRGGGHRLARGSRRGSAGELVQIVGSRSLLLDVHLLGGRD